MILQSLTAVDLAWRGESSTFIVAIPTKSAIITNLNDIEALQHIRLLLWIVFH